jgi:hypothetical protein
MLLGVSNVAADSDAEMRVYDRLGPKTKTAIGNAHRIIDIRYCLGQFARQRKRPEGKWVGDDYVQPPVADIYSTAEGDAELADWIESNVIRRDAKMSLDELTLRPLRTGPVTRRAMRANAARGAR